MFLTLEKAEVGHAERRSRSDLLVKIESEALVCETLIVFGNFSI